jgi:tetratricopeptide (TPR) repeat protein
MTKSQTDGSRPTLRDMPFAELVQSDPGLVEARREYAAAAPARRRAAAEWEYDSAMADHLFAEALGRVKNANPMPTRLDSGVLALAIDPLYAPALLTVGSLEHQYGRAEAAMGHFLALTRLPQGEPDLAEIVEKAGSFLLDRKDYGNALRLYEAAIENHPAMAIYWTGVGYCLGKLGNKEAAVTAARRAVALEPTNAVHLTDLGWSLAEAGAYAEARTVLEQAVARAPAGYDLPCRNLAELDRRERTRRKRGAERPQATHA